MKKVLGNFNYWLSIAEKNSISKATFRSRVRNSGWGLEKAATTPVMKHKPRTDQEWIEKAKLNGISYDTYHKRVHDLFWSPEEAANSPIKSVRECTELARTTRSEFSQVKNERLFKDKSNLFKLTPLHIEEARKNGISKSAVEARVQKYGWTVHEAITVPPAKRTKMTEEYSKYLEIAKRNNIGSDTFYHRVKSGWSYEDASTKGINEVKNHRSRPDKEWQYKAVQNGIKSKTYKARIKLGWSPEEASSVPTLESGQHLNEERKQNSKEAFKKFKNIKRS